MRRKSNVRVFLLLIRIVYAFMMAANFLLPVTKGSGVIIHVLRMFHIVFWTYGMLGSHGYFKRIVSESEDGEIIYDTPVPIAQVGIVRSMEFLILFIFNRSVFLYKNFLCLLALDILFLVLLLLDKSSGYYVSVKEDE